MNALKVSQSSHKKAKGCMQPDSNLCNVIVCFISPHSRKTYSSLFTVLTRALSLSLSVLKNAMTRCVKLYLCIFMRALLQTLSVSLRWVFFVFASRFQLFLLATVLGVDSEVRKRVFTHFYLFTLQWGDRLGMDDHPLRSTKRDDQKWSKPLHACLKLFSQEAMGK